MQPGARCRGYGVVNRSRRCSGGESLLVRCDPREIHGPLRAQVRHDLLFVARARQHRLPAVEVLAQMHVAAGDNREARFRNPGEQLPAIEELEAMREGGELRVARELLRQPRRARRSLDVVRGAPR